MGEENRIGLFLRALQAHRPDASGRHAKVDKSTVEATHQLFQVSTLNAIVEGVFDGTMTMGELRRHGDFGIGTFNALDGELVAVDGEFFQLRSDGSARVADDDLRTPFAVVQNFRPETTADLVEPVTLGEIGELVHSLAASDNYFYAVRIDGLFSCLTLRAVPRQVMPYPTLVEATAHQSVFDLKQVEGSIVGFRFPDFSQGINMAGLHLHFISLDRHRGGHVLDLVVESGALTLDHTTEFHLELPEVEAFGSSDLAKNEREAINQAEGLPE
jgi:acetolactate decarboxylase